MHTHPFSLVVIAAAAVFALCGCNDSSLTQMQGAASGDIGVPAAIPPDLHLPSSYKVTKVMQSTAVRLASDTPVATLVTEYNHAMASSGWQGAAAPSEDMPVSGRYKKDDRAVIVVMGPNQQKGGSSVELFVNVPSCKGSDVSMNGDLPANVHLPSANHGIGDGVQTTQIEMHADASLATLADEYERAMVSAGWEKGEMSKSMAFAVLRFTKGLPHHDGRRLVQVNMMSSLLRGGTNLTIMTHSERRLYSIAPL
jgi:hypothetical protein